MKVVIVTGMSGAGKTQAIKILEDLGYFCVDNMLPELVESFVETYERRKNKLKNIALGIDIRSGESFETIVKIVEKSKRNISDLEYKIIFLDAQNDMIVKRYKENRRVHPLAQDKRIIDAVIEERSKIGILENIADYKIDTSELLIRQLKEKLVEIFIGEEQVNHIITINILSFGFKYGVPNDADIIFDVRFLPNPFYIDNLKKKTGNDLEVRDYVLGFQEAGIFIDKVNDMLDFLIPNYIKEGKTQLVIGVGCTGGQHRSITIARVINENLKKKNYKVNLIHREIERYCFDK